MGWSSLILLDTHALVWAVADTSRLGRESSRLIDEAASGGALLISPISAWELAMLVAKKRFLLTQPTQLWFDTLLSKTGIELAAVTPAIGIDAGHLTGIHGDPADRILIATARALDCPLMTADQRILSYAENGHLKVMDARR
jgi:PIN domain nuclease of toxin-antitoxin system